MVYIEHNFVCINLFKISKKNVIKDLYKIVDISKGF